MRIYALNAFADLVLLMPLHWPYNDDWKGDRTMKHVDVTGLPDEITSAIQLMVDSLRAQLRPMEMNGPQKTQPLLTRKGKVVGPINRESLYGELE